MSERIKLQEQLIDVNDTVLVVIDIQDSFLEKYDDSISTPFLEKSIWIIEVAQCLNIPIIAMAEDIKNAGSVNAEIHNALPTPTKIHDKNSFGLAGQTEILEAVKSTKRNTVVIIGAETDVCVSQSALGLLSQDFKVAVLKDATITTKGDEEIGYSRMRDAGIVISSVKAVLYEWVRTVNNLDDLNHKYPHLINLTPKSLVL